LNSELELGFPIQKESDPIIKFKTKSKGFESNSDLNLMWVGLNRMEDGKAYYSIGLHYSPMPQEHYGPSPACQAFRPAQAVGQS
jgi:hypothetical protein